VNTIESAEVFVASPGRNFVTLRITTSDGVTGLGDATLNGRELAVASYLRDHIVPLLIGKDPARIEDMWQYLYRGVYWRRGSVTMTAIAAVDTALWDIKGKVAGLPVYQLLGGRSRDGVMVYGDAEAHLRIARAMFERLGANVDAQRVADLGERLQRGGTPTRTVRTFLFTDIVGSTSLMGVIGDEAWDDLRRWHDQTLRGSFADHGGEEIDHAGDGFFVAFPDTTSALASAVEIQRRLVEHRRANGFAPQVRIGVHATAATHDGADYTGLGVHTAARISSLAGAGEILASTETMGEALDVRTSAARTAHLKGIAEPVDVVAIEWRD
jgi:class 3 adenylate cyclase